jgi:hypothetical protein
MTCLLLNETGNEITPPKLNHRRRRVQKERKAKEQKKKAILSRRGHRGKNKVYNFPSNKKDELNIRINARICQGIYKPCHP